MSQQKIKIPTGDFKTSAEVEYVQEHETGFAHFRILKKLIASADDDLVIASLPANSIVENIVVQARDVGSAPITTGTHLGIGITGDLDKFAEIVEASIDNSDLYIDTTLPGAPVLQSAAADILAASTNGSGAAAGSFTGTWDVLITGRTFVGTV